MKKEYIKPAMQVVKIQQTMQVLTTSPLDVPVHDDEVTDEGAVW